MAEATTPLDSVSHQLPVRSAAVSVIEGPDAGLRADSPDGRLSIGTADDAGLTLKDPTVSRYHCELKLEAAEVRLLDLSSRNGTFVGAVRIADALLPVGTAFRVGKSVLRVEPSHDALVALHPRHELHGIVGRSAAVRRLMALVEKAGPSSASVLLHGESGVGKELVAQALHTLSGRKGAFVVVDCGALTPTLISSELFGHERGAFTGAEHARVGAFERAAGGTLFLDEIGELPAELQPSLLGVLERKTLRRLGASTEVAVDVRVVGATHRDLRADVNQGQFRLDLYYRLAVLRLELPALRERAEDVPLLVEHFLSRRDADAAARALFTPELIDALKQHAWPGNVRALHNFVQATLDLGEVAALDDLGAAHGVAGGLPALEALLVLDYAHARDRLLSEFERAYLRHALARADGNVAQAAREVGLNRTHLFEMIRRHGLRKPGSSGVD